MENPAQTRAFEWADAETVFGRMLAGEEVGGHPRVLSTLDLEGAGQSPEEGLRGGVVGRHRGLENLDALGSATQQLQDQSSGQAPASGVGSHSYLPDEEGLRPLGWTVADDEAVEVTIGFRHQTGVGEVETEEGVEIGGVALQDPDPVDQAPDASAVGGTRMTGAHEAPPNWGSTS